MFNYEKFQKDFKRLADSDNLSHAYLFFGPASVKISADKSDQKEKFNLALEIANYLENNPNVLEECLIIEQDKKGVIGIDAARKIDNFLYQKPVLSKKRTVIINNAENMTSEAQNAVLKTVEEPPQDALIIFIAKSEDSLLAPLASRLQKIYFASNYQYKSDNYQHEPAKISINQHLINLHKSASLEKIIESDKINEYFEGLIAELRKNPVKNMERIKEALKRLSAIKMFNVNKKLQLKCLR